MYLQLQSALDFDAIKNSHVLRACHVPSTVLSAMYVLCLNRRNEPLNMKPILKMRSGNMLEFTNGKWQEGSLNRGLAARPRPFQPAVHINRMPCLYMLQRQGLEADTAPRWRKDLPLAPDPVNASSIRPFLMLGSISPP